MSAALIINWIQSTLTWSAPLIICAMGEVFAERSGVINMGIEGIMLFGALCGVSVCYYSGSPFVAILASIVVGAVLGLAVSYLTVSRRTNQVVTGLMVNMLATGATNLIFALLKETRHNRAQTFSALFPESTFDIVFSSGVLQYIPPAERRRVLEGYKAHTAVGGIHVLNVFVDKPFLPVPPVVRPPSARKVRSASIFSKGTC